MSIRELPDFLKLGFPEGPAPREYPRPGRMSFPEIAPRREPWGHDPLGAEEVAWREWLLWVDGKRTG
jgi:hypothetical protein